MTTSTISSRASLSGVIAALALVGCIGLALPFELGLFAQAALIVALLGALVLSGLSNARAWLREIPWTLRVGIGMYAAAAAFGCAVGLLSANPLRFVASQTIAMALLPLSALAFGIQARYFGRELARGLAVAALVAVGLHLCALFVPFLASQNLFMGRLNLRYGTNFTAGALVTLLVAGAHAAVSERSRLSGAGTLAALGLLIIGMSRGAWVSAALGVAVALLTGAGLRGRRTAMLLATGAAALAATAAFALWGATAGDLLIDSFAPSGRSGSPAGTGRERTATLMLSQGAGPQRVTGRVAAEVAAVAIRCRITGPPGERARLLLIGWDREGRRTFSNSEGVVGSGARAMVRLVRRVPKSVTSIELALAGHQGTWTVADLTAHGLGSSPRLAARYLYDRIASLADLATGTAATGTVRYRLDEWRAVEAQWRAANVGRVLLGQGLGARVAFTNSGWGAEGRRISLPETSYLHNFYIFLGFKLGLAGLAALAGLLLVAAGTACRAVSLRGSREDRWICAAAAGVWVACLVWGVSSPEIIDFRIAPLLGALVAATSRPARGTAGAPVPH